LNISAIIKIDAYNFELYRFKVCAFLRHSIHSHVLFASSLGRRVTYNVMQSVAYYIPTRHDECDRAVLTIWRALRTPQRRGPTGKLDAEVTEKGLGGVSPPQLTRGLRSVV